MAAFLLGVEPREVVPFQSCGACDLELLETVGAVGFVAVLVDGETKPLAPRFSGVAGEVSEV